MPTETAGDRAKKKVREKRYRDGKEEENTKQGNEEIRKEKKS